MQIDEVVQSDSTHRDALAMRGGLELERGDWNKAKDTFKSILQSTNNEDTYAALALVSGNRLSRGTPYSVGGNFGQ